jgi:hypothetical protein
MADGELKIDHNEAEAAPQPQPGQVIDPGHATPKNETATSPRAKEALPAQPASVSQAPQPQPKPQLADVPVETKPEPSEAPSMPSRGDEISWTASEFVAHEKSAGWYFGLALAGAAIAGLVFLITRDYISAVVVLVGTFALGVLGSKKPKQQQYVLGPRGLTAGQKQYDYSAFKSFAVVPEGAFSSIVFMPLKGFAPLTTIYYPPEDERKITDLLAQHLPFEEHKLDAVDHLMQRIRF